MHNPNHINADLSLFDAAFIEKLEQSLSRDWSSYLYSYPEIEPEEPPFEFLDPDLFIFSGDPDPQPSDFDDATQNIELIEDLSPVDEINSYIMLETLPPFPFPIPVCLSCPTVDLTYDLFLGDHNSVPSINYFDDATQDIELIGDLPPADSFDIFG